MKRTFKVLRIAPANAKAIMKRLLIQKLNALMKENREPITLYVDADAKRIILAEEKAQKKKKGRVFDAWAFKMAACPEALEIKRVRNEIELKNNPFYDPSLISAVKSRRRKNPGNGSAAQLP